MNAMLDPAMATSNTHVDACDVRFDCGRATVGVSQGRWRKAKAHLEVSELLRGTRH
jgi:hypothetical protein